MPSFCSHLAVPFNVSFSTIVKAFHSFPTILSFNVYKNKTKLQAIFMKPIGFIFHREEKVERPSAPVTSSITSSTTSSLTTSSTTSSTTSALTTSTSTYFGKSTTSYTPSDSATSSTTTASSTWIYFFSMVSAFSYSFFLGIVVSRILISASSGALS